MFTRVLATRVLTHVVYLLYVGLAIAAFQESKKIFDANADEFDKESKRWKYSIKFCTKNDGKTECMDPSLITNIVPVSATLSIVAIGAYVLLHCCSAKGGVSTGVAVGFGAALALMLFQSMWGFLTIAFICDYYAKHYDSYNESLTGNKNVIWATGVAALLSSVLTAIDAALLASSRAMGQTAGKTPAVGARCQTAVQFSPALATTTTQGGLGLPGSESASV